LKRSLLRKKQRKRCVVYPDNKARARWELTVTILLLLTLLITPWNLGFSEEENTETIVFESLLDIVFFVDLIVNFFFAFNDKNTELVDDSRTIAVTYLKTWFIVDLVATLPLNLILTATGGFGLG
jgi:hypothetical protein